MTSPRSDDLEQRYRAAIGHVRATPTPTPAAFGALRAVARAGHVGAMFELGALYKLGQRVRRNRVVALGWMLRAAWGGDTDAEIQAALIADALRPEQVARAVGWARAGGANQED